IGKGGTMKILVDREEVARGRIERTVPIAFALETVDVGLDWGRPVAGDYTRNTFSGGTLGPVVVELGKEEPVKDEQQALKYHVPMAVSDNRGALADCAARGARAIAANCRSRRIRAGRRARHRLPPACTSPARHLTR